MQPSSVTEQINIPNRAVKVCSHEQAREPTKHREKQSAFNKSET